MKIENLKELQKVISLCRRLGVEAMEVDGVKFNLGSESRTIRKLQIVADDFSEANLKVPKPNLITQSVQETVADVIKTDGLTDEQLLFYSSRSDETIAQG